MRLIIFIIPMFVLIGCIRTYKISESQAKSEPKSEPITTCYANYSFSLAKVERPEKASTRYSTQIIDTITSSKYKFSFEDDLVKILWSISSKQIAFSVFNKTNHSIKIPWDEAAYIDEKGSSHRVMHSGVKYTDRQQPQAPSIIARKASIEDIVFPTDYVIWDDGSGIISGRWKELSLLPDYDFQSKSKYFPSDFSSFEAFDEVAKSKVGKTIQVLLPFQIEEVINDYIFSFQVDSVSTRKELK